jgi:hypothetical protein
MKSRRMGCEEYVESVEEVRTVYRDLVWQCEEKIRLGWPGLRPEDTISIDSLKSEVWSGFRKGRVTDCFCMWVPSR